MSLHNLPLMFGATVPPKQVSKITGRRKLIQPKIAITHDNWQQLGMNTSQNKPTEEFAKGKYAQWSRPARLENMNCAEELQQP